MRNFKGFRKIGVKTKMGGRFSKMNENSPNLCWCLFRYIVTKACIRVVFGRVTRRTRWPRIVGSCENLPGYPVYKDYRDLC